MIWNEEFEKMPRLKLEELQLERLKDVISRVYNSVPYYQKKLEDSNVTPQTIKSMDDLKRIPFTVKEDFRQNYPFGLFAVPLKDIVRIHASSGTTGQASVVGYTKKDIKSWAETMARTLCCAGTTDNDIVHISYGYGLFTGGLGVHYGAELIGASVIPISGGNTKRQILIMNDFGSTILACTPSYALYMAEVAEEMGIDFKSLKLKAGVFGAEPWSEEMRDEIELKLNLMALDIYGLSEIIGPGVASECEQKSGLHINEDHFLVEVINPDTGEVLEPGETGELVFTTLTKEGIPVLRYRTRDIASLNIETCSCGRTLARMSRVKGRTDDMLIIRGVNVFPSQIETILMEVEGTEPHYQLIVERVGNMDQLNIQVEVSKEIFTDEVRGLEKIEKKIKDEIKNILGVNASVTLVEPKTIERSMGKAKRVIDNRQIN